MTLTPVEIVILEEFLRRNGALERDIDRSQREQWIAAGLKPELFGKGRRPEVRTPCQ